MYHNKIEDEVAQYMADGLKVNKVSTRYNLSLLCHTYYHQLIDNQQSNPRIPWI